MLILLDRKVFDRLAPAPFPTANLTRILVSPPSERSGPLWLLPGTDETRDLAAWLREPNTLRNRPQENRFLLVWERIDPRLLDALSLLARQRQDFAIRASVLLAGPLDPGVDLNAMFDVDADSARPRFLSSIFFIGNQDTAGDPVTPDRRSQIAAALLDTLLAAGERAADPFGIFVAHGDEARSYGAFGLRFWGRRPSDIAPLVRRFALQVLWEKIARGQAAGLTDDRSLADSVGALLNRLKSLDTPVSAIGAEGAPRRFPQRLSPRPVNPFEGWSCPMTRAAALREGGHIIDRHKPVMADYRRTLAKELGSLSAEIRRHGEDLFRTTRKEIRETLSRSANLAKLAALLRAYFPAFGKLRDRALAQDRSPCEPASTPILADCRRRFVDEARTLLEQQVRSLPTFARLLVVWSVAAFLMVIAGTMLRLGAGPGFAAIPGAGGPALGVGVTVWARYRARRVAEGMREHFEESHAWLRESFVRKLEWVVAKTQRMLEFQVIADAVALGRRLGRRFDDFFHAWQDVLTKPPDGDPAADLEGCGVGPDEQSDLRDSIADVSRQIVSEVASDLPEAESGRQIDNVFATLAGRVHAASSDSPVPEEQVLSGIEEHARVRISPPILASLGDALLQNGLSKTYVLPSAYSSDLDSRLQAGLSGYTVKIVRARISGPAAWIARTGLTEDEMRDSLLSAQVRS